MHFSKVRGRRRCESCHFCFSNALGPLHEEDEDDGKRIEYIYIKKKGSHVGREKKREKKKKNGFGM